MKIREVETTIALSFFYPKYEQICFSLFISKVLKNEMSLVFVGTFFRKFRKYIGRFHINKSNFQTKNASELLI